MKSAATTDLEFSLKKGLKQTDDIMLRDLLWSLSFSCFDRFLVRYLGEVFELRTGVDIRTGVRDAGPGSDGLGLLLSTLFLYLEWDSFIFKDELTCPDGSVGRLKKND